MRGDFDEDEVEDYELRPGVDYGDTVVEAGSTFDLDDARGTDPPTQPEATKGTKILIGDVVLVGGRTEPPQFQLVTTDHERVRWHTRRDEITTVFRPVWRKDQPTESTGPHYIIPDGP